ncbi:MAG: hypothetical protein HQK77_00190 [Desulfobacterales bacterium]|nr:hypothetical protein [Desulfobacterales bacterium]
MKDKNNLKPETIREKYYSQFEQAMEFAKVQIQQGISKQRVVKLLNSKGFKTRSGKEWKYNILNNELAKMRKSNDIDSDYDDDFDDDDVLSW